MTGALRYEPLRSGGGYKLNFVTAAIFKVFLNFFSDSIYVIEILKLNYGTSNDLLTSKGLKLPQICLIERIYAKSNYFSRKHG